MKKKIIQVVPAFNIGGAESLVRNYLLSVDRRKYDVEAFVTGMRLHTSIEEELENNSVKVTFLSELYHVSNKLPKFARRILVALRWRRAVKRYFREAEPDVVHCHLSVARTLIVAKKELHSAKLFYTVHSDPDKYWGNGKNLDEQNAIKYFVKENPFTFIALHKDAETKIRNYFGENCHVCILNNAIDLKKYEVTPEKRSKMRIQLGISQNAFVVGHVGRFLPVKNHDFLLNVFKCILEERKDSILCLVGDGELREKVERKAQLMGLGSSVLFLGNRSDVSELLSAFDVFVLPSLWEGFPITLIEAQAAKLPCFVSAAVNNDVKLTNLVTFLQLELSADTWAKAILNKRSERFVDEKLFEYDILNVVQKLFSIYGL